VKSARDTAPCASPVAAVAVLVIAFGGCDSRPLDAIAIDPSSLTRGLVAHWSFDETSGATASDSSGNGHDGLVTGGTWTSAGRFGGALTLSSGAFVSVANFPQAAASWTVSLWTRSSAASLATNTTDFSTIISNENQYSGGWEIHLDNRPSYQRFDAAYWAGRAMDDFVRVFCRCIQPDRWIHLTTVWDGEVTNTMTFFVDGRAVDQALMPGRILTGDATLHIGTWNQGGRFFTGDVDDFAIWSRALAPPEIETLARQSPGP
jgi:hypothetical protein